MRTKDRYPTDRPAFHVLQWKYKQGCIKSLLLFLLNSIYYNSVRSKERRTSSISKGECQMKKIFLVAILVMSISACGVPAAVPPNSAPPTSAPNSAATAAQGQIDMATYVAQTVQAQQPAATLPATATQAPTATAVPPTAQSASVVIAAGQNWNGVVNWQGYTYPVDLAILKVNGSSFTGAMVWSAPICRVTTSVKGDIIQDITTATEQNRWALLPDFKSGDKSGTWLRWTQIDSIGSTRCYLTSMSDWWYAHIGSDGHVTGIHFENDTATQPSSLVTFDFSLSSQ